MSLRNFHIFFIVTALGLLGFLLWWAGYRLIHGEDGKNLVFAVCAFLGLAGGLPYLGWFIRKSKNL